MKNKKSLIYSLIAIAGILIFFIWSGFLKNGNHNHYQIEVEEAQEEAEAPNPYKDTDLTYEIIEAPGDTYGYNILMNGRILIHQPGVPALPGNEGFRTEEAAQKTAEYIIHKLRNNIFPPSMTVQELDSLGVL